MKNVIFISIFVLSVIGLLLFPVLAFANDGIPYNSVVRIKSESAGGISLGSGTVVQYGHRIGIVTANHVIEGGTVSVRIDGQYRPVRVLYADKIYDFAILSVPDGPIPKPAKIAVPKFPLIGTISGYGGNGILCKTPVRYKNDARPVGGNASDWMTLHGQAVSGDSGGPLFSVVGEVVGVVWGASPQSQTSTATQAGRIMAAWQKLDPTPVQAWCPDGNCTIGGRILGGQRQPSGRQVVEGGGGVSTLPEAPLFENPASPVIPVQESPMLPELYRSIENQGEKLATTDKRLAVVEDRLGIMQARTDDADLAAQYAANESKTAVAKIEEVREETKTAVAGVTEKAKAGIKAWIWEKALAYGPIPALVICFLFYFVYSKLDPKKYYYRAKARVDYRDGTYDWRYPDAYDPRNTAPVQSAAAQQEATR